jgi:tRNA(Arg) A34 adenosine deaminase TadA
MFLIKFFFALFIGGLFELRKTAIAFLILARRSGVPKSSVHFNFLHRKLSQADENLYTAREISDDELIQRLDLMKPLSPAKKISQQVGCLLLSDDSILISTTNDFKRNVGVHAEMNAISQFLNIIPAHIGPLNMAITYSPCLQCAELILLISQIKSVSYELKYDDDGMKLLEEGGVMVRKLAPRSFDEKIGSIRKLHSYSKLSWAPNVTSILIIRVHDDVILLSHEATDPFDVRPYLIQALGNRTQSSESLQLSYSGNLNHRESLFLEILGINSTRHS